MTPQFGRMPDEVVVPCCSSAVYSGGDRCDCWVVELAAPQQMLCEGPVNVRRKACDDCAYRRDSVEHARGEDPNPGGALIFCHWDAPMVTRVIHPPSGVVIDFEPGEVYDPVQHGNRYWKVDGRPQDYCAVSGALTGSRRAPSRSPISSTESTS